MHAYHGTIGGLGAPSLVHEICHDLSLSLSLSLFCCSMIRSFIWLVGCWAQILCTNGMYDREKHF